MLSAATTTDGRIEDALRGAGGVNNPQRVEEVGPLIFQAVVGEDYDSLAKLFASHARSSLVSYMSMKSRWARQQESKAKSEEKLDEFLQHLSYSDSPKPRLSPFSAAKQQNDTSVYYLLQELSKIIASYGKDVSNSHHHTAFTTSAPSMAAPPGGVSNEADRYLWDASAKLGDARPPGNLCVYDKNGATSMPEGQENVPPIFDGAVANATPPPMGGAGHGASAGAGTILHLACAMDKPLVLAFLLIMGADGRAPHTAFRRLMIHEAACNGSINCLTLLLEMGHKLATKAAESRRNNNNSHSDSNGVPFLPDAMELSANSATTNVPALAARPPPPIAMNMRHFRRAFTRNSDYHNDNNGNNKIIGDSKHADFLSILRQFQNCVELVRKGEISELQAARSLMANAPLLETTRTSLIRSCAFQNDGHSARSFLRPYGCADGHGNTPLHWAAFKDETECVALLLDYNADPNARAHPSGWTPLHDAAYSNSSKCIEQLIQKGAHVDARANSGATPLCFAAQEDAAEAAMCLLARGADLSARCAGAPDDVTAQPFQVPNHAHSRFSGYTPLHYCAHYNAQRASKILLKHEKAKIAMETPDLSGRLPIHVAVARGSSDVLKSLLNAGARVDIRPSNSPRTPLSLPVLFGQLPQPSVAERRPPSPEEPATPNRSRTLSRSSSSSTASPVTSPVLRSMIPSQPINSSKPWNCLSQQAIDECKMLISKAEQSWSPEHHLLFTPQDRKAVMQLLKVGKRLEQQGVIFVDLWPQVLSFCGRGWFEVEDKELLAIEHDVEMSEDDNDQVEDEVSSSDSDDDYLALPSFR
ncbi:pfs, nacht and ankyrin domain containing protein [Nitzschia inconspicua]|uniref:Pfs, nacht and ankyrin domain containing protein n=1 Tax=Nitzschia inconspicua TaxID=303405 RepID=A0A9K3PH74_9STRA|nr:pfs, nacht and ankyrin domain containing protein [Nitzschia inconspicua]